MSINPGVGKEPPRKTARIVNRDDRLDGGTEGSLETLARAMLWICIAGGISGLFIALWGGWGFRWMWVAAAISAFFQAWVFYVILRASADVVRMLKKHLGLTYSGAISEAGMMRRTVCSACGARAASYDVSCGECGREFQRPGE